MFSNLFFGSTLIALVAASELPVIDISPLLTSSSDERSKANVISEIGRACRHVGFFYISNHGVDLQLQKELENIAIHYFDLPNVEKLSISMDKGGKAWRGSFLVGDEVTSGIPDQKEGLYFGKELKYNVNETRPLHGVNLWPKGPLGQRMKPVVLTYMDEMTRLGTVLMAAIATSLGLSVNAFGQQFEDPTTLFRMFHYPSHDTSRFSEKSVGVGEHTDYGYLTLLKQDDNGGLQAKTLGRDSELTWVDVPPLPNTFVVNLGDALQHNTGGLLLATTHRVQQRRNATRSRFSFPFFFDPNFSAEMVSVQELLSKEDKLLAARNREMLNRIGRWDKADPAQFRGPYGAYLVNKVAAVFPELARKVNLTGLAVSTQPAGMQQIEVLSAGDNSLAKI